MLELVGLSGRASWHGIRALGSHAFSCSILLYIFMCIYGSIHVSMGLFWGGCSGNVTVGLFFIFYKPPISFCCGVSRKQGLWDIEGSQRKRTGSLRHLRVIHMNLYITVLGSSSQLIRASSKVVYCAI